MKSGFVLALSVLLSIPTSILSLAQDLQSNHITIDASVPVPPPETGYLHLGGTSSNGHSLEVNSRYLVLDGKPWLPVMGELHYSRLPEDLWEAEILKMQAAGINIISTYIFWIHHEETEGQFDWSGRRNLRRFVELCEKHGMYVWLRPGPWGHGEVRNGGFPDWVTKLPDTRTNDPVYLQHVTSFLKQVGDQVHGLSFKDGGPIVGVQLENEYSLHGPGRGAEHILKLKQIALAAGIDAPLFSVTGWPSLDFPPQEVIPVSGGYPDGFWYGSQTRLPPSITYLFNFNRELGDMGATVASEDPTGKVNLAHDPYFAAEEAGGMASAYHRRPVMAPDDIASLALTGVGSGVNLYGYYMFHGGTNPVGANTTLQESQATGYPNDLPQLDYDFGAPLGAFGQQRASLGKLRMLHLFLNAYGSQLAPMAAFAPVRHTRDAADTSTPRVAVRTNGTSGFIFVNNYVRQLPMPARPAFQIDVQLPGALLKIPAQPVNVPANSYFVWPFQLSLGAATLQYSTAQLLTRITSKDTETVVFFAISGIAPEFAFDARHLHTITVASGKVTRTNGRAVVTDLKPGLNATIQLTDDQGARTTLLLLTSDQAQATSQLHIAGSDYLFMTASSLFFDGAQLHLRSLTPAQQVSAMPALPAWSCLRNSQGLWTSYRFTQPTQSFKVDVEQIRQATPRAAMDMGRYVDWRKGAVPSAPGDVAFQQAATWKLRWTAAPGPGISQLLLRVRYSGDVARLRTATTLVDDNFFNGTPWEVGFNPDTDHVTALTLEVLPMPARAPIYLAPGAQRILRSSPTNPSLLGVALMPVYEVIMQPTKRD